VTLYRRLWPALAFSTAGAGVLNFENIIPQRRHSGPSSCSKPHFGQVRAALLCNDEDCNRMDVTVAQRRARRKEFREIAGLQSSCGVFHGGGAVLLARPLHVVTEGLKDGEQLAI
jgi:hypothetical protein